MNSVERNKLKEAGSNLIVFTIASFFVLLLLLFIFEGLFFAIFDKFILFPTYLLFGFINLEYNF